MEKLRHTITKVDCDAIVVATPMDIRRIMKLDKPAVRVSYEIEQRSTPTLEEMLSEGLMRSPS